MGLLRGAKTATDARGYLHAHILYVPRLMPRLFEVGTYIWDDAMRLLRAIVKLVMHT